MVLLGLGQILFAQDSLANVPIIWKGGVNDEIQSLIDGTTHFPKDTAKISQYFLELSLAMQSKGFPAFRYGIDSSSQDTVVVYLEPGPRYVLQSLELLDLPEAVNALSLLKWVDSNPPLDWELLDSKLEPLLTQFPNWGYPFARLDREKLDYKSRDSFTMEVGLRYQFQKGPLGSCQVIDIYRRFPGEKPICPSHRSGISRGYIPATSHFAAEQIAQKFSIL